MKSRPIFSAKIVLIALIFFSGMYKGKCEMRYIHVIKILDSQNEDYNIREGSQRVSYVIDREVELVRENLGILAEPQVYQVLGQNFTTERLDELLALEMNYIENDIVFIVYVGHGRRANQVDAFPILEIGEGISYREIYDKIYYKSPSFIFSLIFACNASVPLNTRPEFPPPSPLNQQQEPASPSTLDNYDEEAFFSQRNPEHYRNMFRPLPDEIKCVFLLSSDVEHYSFMDANGGYFLYDVFAVFERYFSKKSWDYFTWRELCESIMQQTEKRGIREAQNLQANCYYDHPIAPISISEGEQTGFFNRIRKLFKRRGRNCKHELSELKEKHKRALALREKRLRSERKEARRNRQGRLARTALSQQKKSALQTLKARQKNEIARLKKNCR